MHKFTVTNNQNNKSAEMLVPDDIYDWYTNNDQVAFMELEAILSGEPVGYIVPLSIASNSALPEKSIDEAPKVDKDKAVDFCEVLAIGCTDDTSVPFNLSNIDIKHEEIGDEDA